MARKLTTKKPLHGNNRSHSLRATKRVQKPNLQKYTLEDGTKIVLSAREIRTMKKTSKQEIEEVVNMGEAA